MKLIKYVICVFIIVILSSGCAIRRNDLYITFTVTIQDDDDDTKFTSDNFYFDLEDEKVVKTATVPYTSQYPFTVYDKYTNNVYYTSRITDKSDQIYSYNLDTKETRQLTEDFLATNYIVPLKDKLLLISSLKKQFDPSDYATLYPIMFDLKQQSYHIVKDWNYDQCIRELGFNPKNEEAIITSYSDSEFMKRIQAQQEDIPFVMPDSNLLKIKDEHVKTLYQSKDEITGVAVNNNRIYFTDTEFQLKYSDDHDDFKKNIRKHDFVMKDKAIIYITDDNRYIYYIEDTVVAKYDTVEKKHTKIYHDQRSISYVNNGIALKSYK